MCVHRPNGTKGSKSFKQNHFKNPLPFGQRQVMHLKTNFFHVKQWPKKNTSICANNHDGVAHLNKIHDEFQPNILAHSATNQCINSSNTTKTKASASASAAQAQYCIERCLVANHIVYNGAGTLAGAMLSL